MSHSIFIFNMHTEDLILLTSALWYPCMQWRQNELRSIKRVFSWCASTTVLYSYQYSVNIKLYILIFENLWNLRRQTSVSLVILIIPSRWTKPLISSHRHKSYISMDALCETRSKLSYINHFNTHATFTKLNILFRKKKKTDYALFNQNASSPMARQERCPCRRSWSTGMWQRRDKGRLIGHFESLKSAY